MTSPTFQVLLRRLPVKEGIIGGFFAFFSSIQLNQLKNQLAISLCETTVIHQNMTAETLLPEKHRGSNNRQQF